MGERGAELKGRLTHPYDIPDLEPKTVEECRCRDRAPKPVPLREHIGERARGIEPDAAVERISTIDRLELDQAPLRAVVAPRHGAHADHLGDGTVLCEIA